MFSSQTKHSWIRFTREVFAEWKKYLAIAFPTILFMCLFLGLEFFSAVAVGFVSTTQQAVHLSVVNVFIVLATPVFEISYAIYSIDGNAIGANDYKKTTMINKIGMIGC
jgi:Na+-driven multidrug efflux pump